MVLKPVSPAHNCHLPNKSIVKVFAPRIMTHLATPTRNKCIGSRDSNGWMASEDARIPSCTRRVQMHGTWWNPTDSQLNSKVHSSLNCRCSFDSIFSKPWTYLDSLKFRCSCRRVGFGREFAGCNRCIEWNFLWTRQNFVYLVHTSWKEIKKLK
jgi:hypothetical protein